MRNIVLVGFMGTGKTTLARMLSERTGMKYISTDAIIEKKEGMTIKDIFSEKGEAHFRKAEKCAIKSASEEKNAVIDAGGGAVMDPENVKNLKQNGIMVCLWAEPEIILKRTGESLARPLLNIPKPGDKIKELLEIRKPFYERADYHVNTSSMSIGEAASLIEKHVKNA